MGRNFAHFPFSPQRCPFFYGWVVVFACTVGMLASIPGQTMGVGVFAEDLLANLSLSRVDLTSAYMYGTCVSGVLLPFAGLLYDRLGARLVVVLASSSLAASVFYLSQCDHLAHQLSLKLGYEASDAAVQMLVLSLGFFLIRFWGQGVLTTISRTTMGKWFHRRRGLAAGISGLAVTAGFSSSPRFLASLIEQFGWREAWMILGAGVGAGMSFIGWLLYRDNPEKCGLRMDGASAEQRDGQDAGPNPTGHREYTLREALGTYPFWVFSGALALSALIGTAWTFHIESFGNYAGMTKTEAVNIFLPTAGCSVVANLFSGWISDRVRIKYLLWAHLISLGTASLGMMHLDSSTGRALIVLGLGISGGIWAILMSVVWPRFYGRRHLGAIASVAMSMTVIASALGPVAFALAEERWGSYDVGCIGSAALCAAGFAAALILRNPQIEKVPAASS